MPGMNARRATAHQSPPIMQFLVWARLAREKGIAELISGWRHLTNPDIRLTIIGDGPLEKSLRVVAGPDQRISIHTQSSINIDESFQRAQVLIAPSLAYETFDLSVVAGWQAGLPVLATNLGAHTEYVTPEVGWLVEPGRPLAWTRMIEHILGDEAGWHARQTAAAARGQDFNWPKHLAAISGAYQEARELQV